MFRTRVILAASLVALALCTGETSAQVKGTGNNKGGLADPQPVDLVLVNMQINEAAKTVTVTVRLDGPQNRPGLASVPVRFAVAGGGATLFSLTQSINGLNMGQTKQITFTKVDFAAMRAQVAQQPLPAVRFLSVTAKVDPANLVGEASEANNLALRILN